MPVSGGLLVQGSPNADCNTGCVRIILKEYITHSFVVPFPGDSDAVCLSAQTSVCFLSALRG